MPTPIKLIAGEFELEAELFDSECARAVADALPLASPFNTWGDEIYFQVPLVCNRDASATSDVDVGTIAYWPAGRAIAIFFGPTPMSTSRKPVAADRVNIIGRLIDDPALLRGAKGAASLTLTQVKGKS